MECLGPTTEAALAQSLGLNRYDVEGALVSLENQGSVLRGRFSGEADLEWCDRRLLARIHRFTLEGLRRQIAPVSPEQFMQFLMRHQHIHQATRLREQPGLLALIEQLEGFEAPAGHWEKFLLPERLESYDGGWLDSLTFFGQVVWGRVRPFTLGVANGKEANGRPMKALTRSTPITLMLRDHVPWLLSPTP
jgi:ATP-dependent Lhr-like helicase